MNFIVDVEKQITDILKDLKKCEVISENPYRSLKQRGSRFVIFYGLCKVNKPLFDNFSPFRPIMSAVKTPTYNPAKFLVALLEAITTNMYTVKSSF